MDSQIGTFLLNLEQSNKKLLQIQSQSTKLSTRLENRMVFLKANKKATECFLADLTKELVVLPADIKYLNED